MKTILFLLVSTGLWAQIHSEKPLPQFTSDPVHILDDHLTGWSYSKDGQWVSGEKTIPVRIVSTDKARYETDENELGLDNIEELQLFGVIYGGDTLAALVKIYNKGNFRMPAIKRGWKTRQEGYFFLFDKAELEKVKDINDEASIIKLNLRDYGSLSEVSTRKVLDKLRKSVIVKPSTERQLVLTAMQDEKENILFQLASMHATFAGVEGVLQDFTQKGQSLYGSPKLLDYLHYQCRAEDFYRFFSLPAESF